MPRHQRDDRRVRPAPLSAPCGLDDLHARSQPPDHMFFSGCRFRDAVSPACWARYPLPGVVRAPASFAARPPYLASHTRPLPLGSP